ncbi:MAG: hypothetical protein R2822_15825 [Spirosomataceae bacterium]
MKKLFTIIFLTFLFLGKSFAQRFVKINEDDRRWWINVGAGPGFLKAGQAYDLKPLFLTKAGLGWQVFASPYYMASNHLNIGLKLGGIFRPTFEDVESNSIIQQKFTSYGLLYADYYLSSPYRILEKPWKPRFYLGLSAGVSYIGKLEAKDLTTEKYYTFQRRNQDAFLSVAPKIGVSFRKVKLEIEHIVTTPFNPDFTSITIISAIPLGTPRYY